MVGKALAVVALVTLPLSVLLWHKSHHHPEQYRYDVTPYRSLRVYLKDGVCGLRLLSMPRKTAFRSEFRSELDFSATPRRQSFRLSSVRKGFYHISWLVFPLWFSTGLLAVVGAAPVVRGPVRQWYRRWHGWCVECGYDLRGTRGVRCSECGTRFR